MDKHFPILVKCMLPSRRKGGREGGRNPHTREHHSDTAKGRAKRPEGAPSQDEAAQISPSPSSLPGTTVNPGRNSKATQQRTLKGGRGRQAGWESRTGQALQQGVLQPPPQQKVTQAWYFLTPSLETEGKPSGLIPAPGGRGVPPTTPGQPGRSSEGVTGSPTPTSTGHPTWKRSPSPSGPSSPGARGVQQCDLSTTGSPGNTLHPPEAGAATTENPTPPRGAPSAS